MPVTIRRNSALKVSIRLQTFLLLAFAFTALVLPVNGQSTPKQSLAIAAASDLQFALPQIVNAYTRSTGNTVKVTYSSSGNLSAQISNGAPFDLLLSADATYPRDLIAKGHAVSGSLTFYARGTLVVWFGDGTNNPTIDALQSSAIRHIAIANPRHAPYGRAAEAALRSAAIYDKVASKLVFGENIAQAVQFVDSGNAEAGLVALSLLQASTTAHKGVWKEVPLDSYPPLDQAAVITQRGSQNSAARTFLTFLKSAESQAILKRFGFRPPSSEKQQ
jgi:molybdate transport system substrate-binding protein